ncbi:MAG: hypothetical protein HRU19_31220 [Pseudobacteriovorax sp.]|nr:hypothetical protein [Pseudobacteriovorax sp.]
MKIKLFIFGFFVASNALAGAIYIPGLHPGGGRLPSFPNLVDRSPGLKTNDFVAFMEEKLKSRGYSAYKRYDYRNNGIGEVVHGNADISIGSLESNTGRGVNLREKSDIFDESRIELILQFDINLTFSYFADSTGKKQCYGVFGSSSCGYAWKNSKPRGNIRISVITKERDGYVVRVSNQITRESNSRAAEVAKIAANEQLSLHAAEVVKNWVALYNPGANTILEIDGREILL